MTWKKLVLKNFKLYGITDLKEYDENLPDKVDEAYRGGVDIVQLRSKTLTDSELFRLSTRLKVIAENNRKLFFINDRPDIALMVGAHGVHIGQDDLPVSEIKKLVCAAKEELFIGKSTHSLQQALDTAKEGVDYVGIGPIYSTPTKPGRPSIGLEVVREVQKRVNLPSVAIGGIDNSNINDVLNTGASRIAMVRALFESENIHDTAKHFTELISRKILTHV